MDIGSSPNYVIMGKSNDALYFTSKRFWVGQKKRWIAIEIDPIKTESGPPTSSTVTIAFISSKRISTDERTDLLHRVLHRVLPDIEKYAPVDAKVQTCPEEGQCEVSYYEKTSRGEWVLLDTRGRWGPERIAMINKTNSGLQVARFRLPG
jgi:hypothetical protein